MKGLITIDRLRDGNIVERSTQPMRSFTKGLIDLLYLMHSNVNYSCRDVGNIPVTIDTIADSTAVPKGTLFAAPPGGDASVYVSHGDTGHETQEHRLTGDMLGIQVGGSAVAVTPTDYALGDRYFHDDRLAIPAPEVVFSHTASVLDWAVYGATWRAPRTTAMPDLPFRPLRITQVDLLVSRTGLPGIVNFEFRLNSEVGVILGTASIDGNILPTAPAWVSVPVDPPITVMLGSRITSLVDLVIVMSAPLGNASNLVNWRGGVLVSAHLVSIDSGTTWSIVLATAAGLAFRIWSHLPAQPTINYGACEIDNLVVANPNAGFQMRRMFYNRTASPVTIRETGIYAAGTQYGVAHTPGNTVPICIARDVLSPEVTVPAGQNLRITYDISVMV